MKTWILLTVAGSIILFILWGNPVSSQPIIQVKGSEDPIVKNQIAQYLDYLDIRENIHLSVYYTAQMPDKLLGMTFCMDSPSSHTYQVIRVYIDNHLDKMKQNFVLAHEMIHVKQYAKGELMVINNQEMMWKGRKFRYQRAADRQLAPWEHEAYKNDRWLAGQYKPQPEAPIIAAVKKR